MDAELKAYLDERFEEMEERSKEMEERLVRRIEKTETKLLTAFYSWAKSMDIRTRGTQERVTALEERITDLEQRLETGPETVRRQESRGRIGELPGPYGLGEDRQVGRLGRTPVEDLESAPGGDGRQGSGSGAGAG